MRPPLRSAAAAVMLALVMLPCIAYGAETTPTPVTLTPESVAALSSSVASDLAPLLAAQSSASVAGTVAVSALPSAPVETVSVGDGASGTLMFQVLTVACLGVLVVLAVCRG